MKDTTKIELNKWPEIPLKLFSQFIIYTNIPVKLQIENVRTGLTGVYRQKVGELEFSDRNVRTGVYR